MELWLIINSAVLWLCAWPASGTIKVGGPDGTQKLTFKAPNLSEEDSHSLYVPEEFKCDACIVVAYQVSSFLFHLRHFQMSGVTGNVRTAGVGGMNARSPSFPDSVQFSRISDDCMNSAAPWHLYSSFIWLILNFAWCIDSAQKLDDLEQFCPVFLWGQLWCILLGAVQTCSTSSLFPGLCSTVHNDLHVGCEIKVEAAH
jgi:hypothetical protein